MIKIDKVKSIIDSTDLCEYIMKKCGSMSHLKLQKLLYYVESFHLAYFNESIIDDQFEAWMHGPVSRKIYNELKDFSILHSEITYVEDEKGDPIKRLKQKLLQDQIDLINDVLDNYSIYNSLELESLTHSEKPWIEARKGITINERCIKKISKATMKEFYKSYFIYA